MNTRTNSLAVICFLCLGLVACKSPSNDTLLPIGDRAVAWADYLPITKSELHHYMLLNKSAVYNEYYRTSGKTFTSTFWAEEIDGQQPIEKLRQQALDDALTFKSQQILAIRMGLDIKIPTDFDSLMLQRMVFNERRAQTVRQGGVVYGPPSLSPRNYVDMIQDQLVQASINHLSLTDFKADEEDILEHYQRYLDEYGSLEDQSSPVSLSSFSVIWQNEQTTRRYFELIEKTKKDLDLTMVNENFISVTL